MIPIEAVTISEDRAVVIRRGRVTLQAGTQVLRIDPFAPVAVDRTIHVRVERGKARPGGIAVVRQRRALSDGQQNSEHAQAYADSLKLIQEIAQKERQRARLLEESVLLDKGAAATWGDLCQDVAHGLSPTTPCPVQAFEEPERQVLQTIAELDQDLEDSRAVLARLRSRLAALENPSTTTHAALAVTLEVEEPGELEIAIEYVVPNACWRPAHTAQLRGTQLTIATDGMLWQNTGESWDNVQLRFSTERPSLGVAPPRLQNDVLRVQRRAETVQVEVREEEIETVGLGLERPTQVPGIDDGGEVRILQAEHRASVPSDGKPHRVRVGVLETTARVDLVCVPELQAAVVLRSSQTNPSKEPLLAGPVDLVRDGGFVGKTSLDFLAPGERFELAWGTEAGVRVRRESETVEEDPSLWSGWSARKHLVQLFLGVLDDTARKLIVTERIPVSELEKVQVVQSVDDTTEGVKADSNGFVQWELELKPHERKKLRLGYVVKRHRDVAGL